MSERLLTVEIHDVSPLTLPAAERIRRSLLEIGVARTSLLVIPRHRDQRGGFHDLRGSPETIRWLKARQDEGSEIIQHGLTHHAPGTPPPGLVNAWMHHWFSRGCAEFAHLERGEALRRLRTGRAILRRCGLEILGFIAPAWQQSEATISAVAMLGYRFTAFINQIRPLDPSSSPGEGSSISTPALTFAAGHPLIDLPKRGVMWGLERWARPAPILRVAIHPEDLTGARPLDTILRRIVKLRPHRRIVTYRQWLERLEQAA